MPTTKVKTKVWLHEGLEQRYGMQVLEHQVIVEI